MGERHELEDIEYIRVIALINKVVDKLLSYCIACSADYEVSSKALAKLSDWFTLASLVELWLGKSLLDAKNHPESLWDLYKLMKEHQKSKGESGRLQQKPEGIKEEMLAGRLSYFQKIAASELCDLFRLPLPTELKQRLDAAAAIAEEHKLTFDWLPPLVKAGGGECPLWKQVAKDLESSEKYNKAIINRCWNYLEQLNAGEDRKEALAGVLSAMHRIVVGKAEHFVNEQDDPKVAAKNKSWLERAVYFGKDDIVRVLKKELGIKPVRKPKPTAPTGDEPKAAGPIQPEAPPSIKIVFVPTPPDVAKSREPSPIDAAMEREKSEQQREERDAANERAKRKEKLNSAIESLLTPELRDAIRLRLKGLSDERIGEKLKISAVEALQRYNQAVHVLEAHFNLDAQDNDHE